MDDMAGAAYVRYVFEGVQGVGLGRTVGEEGRGEE